MGESDKERFDIHSASISKDGDFEGKIRPQGFNEFSGQEKILENLTVFVQAAKLRGEALDHLLLHGPPGLGKTTLANIIANELGVNIKKYRMLERNEVNPDAELLMRIYEVTGCKPSLLLEPEKAEEMIINDLWNLVDIRFREEILILLKQGASMLTK